MKKLIALVIFISTALNSYGANIKLEVTEANCKKVDGIGVDSTMTIATKYKTSIKTVSFLGAKWGKDPLWGETCQLLFDTGVGPKRCVTLNLLSDDGGKTAFGIPAPNLCQ